MFSTDIIGSGTVVTVPHMQPQGGHAVTPMQTWSASAASTAAEHQKWMIELLKENGGICTFEEVCKKGEEMNCLRIRCKLEDATVFSVLKQLKQAKVVHFEHLLLQWPQHKDARITLLKPDFVI